MDKVKKYGYVFSFTILIIIALLIGFTIKEADSKLTPVEINDNSIKIMYNTYTEEDTVEVELLNEISLSDGSGLNTANINNGRYKVNGDEFKSKVYIHKNISPFIKLKTKDSTIVFNENNSDKTKEIYNKLMELAQNSEPKNQIRYKFMDIIKCILCIYLKP